MSDPKQIAQCRSLADHKELLEAGGYLAPMFKTPTQLGYWLKELDEQFDQCYQQAHLEGHSMPLVIELWGRFNEQLDPVKYEFRYRYDPTEDSLQLFSLYCRHDRNHLTYDFAYHTHLPSPEDVYNRFAIAASLNKHQELFKRLHHEFRRDRDPANDHSEEETKMSKGPPPPMKLRFRR